MKITLPFLSGAAFYLCALLILLCGAPSSTSQTNHQADIWYFGRRAGLKFDGSALPTPLYDGALNTLDGSAVISDRVTGELLFYSDGSTVWNAEHQPMPNGTGLLGDESSGQPAMIVPDPGNPDRYYLFTTGSNDVSDRTFRYSIVDMRRDTGRGDVIEKNTPLIERGSEKVTATRHCNGRDYWVLTQEWGTNRFFAYYISAEGIGDPVISELGDSWPSGNDVQGTAQFSPDGSTLAVTSAGLRQLAFFDFDPATGDLSNYRIVATGKNYYGAEFSPDQSKFYTITLPNNTAEVLQFDLDAGDSAAIAMSETLLYTQPGNWRGGQLQIGPDGAIYVSLYLQSAVGRIAYPDRAGLACEYTNDAIPLDNRALSYGLPNFIDSDLPNVVAGARGVSFSLTPSRLSAAPGEEISWSLEVCNDGNRDIDSISLSLDLPFELTDISSHPDFPLVSISSIAAGDCISFVFNTRLEDSVTGDQDYIGCAYYEAKASDFCIPALVECATVQVEVPTDPCPTPTLIYTHLSGAEAEGSGDEVQVPIYYTGIPAGERGPDIIELTVSYTVESSILSTTDLDDLTDNTATEDWDISIIDSRPGEVRFRLARGSGDPLTSADSLLLIIPVTLYMPVENFAAESTLLVTATTEDRCFAFEGSTGKVLLDICGLDVRRIESLLGGRLALGPPVYDGSADHLTIPFAIPISCNASISVCTLDGRTVAETTPQFVPAGEHRVEVEGMTLPSGTYIVHLSTEVWTESRIFAIQN